MKFNGNLQEGTFLKRYKRFFADIESNSQVLVAHVPNTGSMKTVNNPGQPCLFSVSDNPERKLKYTLEMIKSTHGAWVGVNTANPNTVMKETLESLISKTPKPTSGPFQFWSQFENVKAEYKISAETRLDFALSNSHSEKMHFIEVKNVTMAEGDVAMFPDSVTERGQKHLKELMNLIDQGHSAEIVFFVQREDCLKFRAAREVDPKYAELLTQAQAYGVKVTALKVSLGPSEILALNDSLELI